MNLVWERLTLSSLPLKEYLSSSYLHRLLVGSLLSWRQSSILIQWGDMIAVGLLSLIYTLTPFVSSTLIGLLLLACVGLWLLLTLSEEVTSANAASFTPIHLLVLLYWGIAAVATALSPVKKAALSDLQTLTLYLLLFALCARVLRIPRFRSWLITLYLHISLIVSVYGIRQWFFGAKALATWVDPESPLAKTTRVYSYLGNPNLLAGYLLPAVIFSFVAIFAWPGWIRKSLALTMFIVNSVTLILTFSRGGWIGLLVGLLTVTVLLIFVFGDSSVEHLWGIKISPQMMLIWRNWSLPIFLGSVVGILAIGMIFVEPFLFEMIRDRPIIGIGPGHNSFNNVYPLYQRPRFTALSAYSVFLETIVETGFLGFTCFLWLIVVTVNTGFSQIRQLRQSENTQVFWLIGAIAVIVGILSHGLVDTVFYRPEVNTLWWFTVALVASFWRPLTLSKK